MKYIATCLFIVFNFFSALAQNNFIRTYNSTATEDFIDIIPVPGGGYFAVGTTIAAGFGTADILLMRLDNNGQIIWSKIFDSGDDDFAAAITILPGGNIAILGTYYPFNQAFRDMMLLTTDSSGLFISMNGYGGTNDELAKDIELLGSGDVVITGQTNSYGGITQAAIAMRINSSGQVVWSNTYGHSQINCFNSVKELSTGYLLFAGYTMDNGNYDGYVVSANSSGIYQWEKILEGPGHDEFSDCIEDLNLQALVAAGVTSDSSLSQTDIYIVAFDYSGVTYNSGVVGTAEFDWCASIHSAPVGNDLIISGYTTVSDSNGVNTQPIAVSLNPLAAQINWAIYYGDGFSESKCQRSIIDPNGYLVLSGYRQEAFQFETSSLLIRMPLQTNTLCNENTLQVIPITSTLTEGSPITFNTSAAVTVTAVTTTSISGVYIDSLFCFSTSVAEHKKAIELTIYPNPVADLLYLDLTSEVNGQGTYLISDMQGREYRKVQFYEKQLRIPVATLPAGLYLITIIDKNGSNTSKFIKLQE